jgi:hypothetical protein
MARNDLIMLELENLAEELHSYYRELGLDIQRNREPRYRIVQLKPLVTTWKFAHVAARKSPNLPGFILERGKSPRCGVAAHNSDFLVWAPVVFWQA